MEWLLAKCRGLNPSFFFGSSIQEVRAAVDFCQTCVVREDCLAYALENREDHGVWGGETERGRRRIRRSRVRVLLQDVSQRNKRHVPEHLPNDVPLHLSCTLVPQMHIPEFSDSAVVLRVPSFDVA